MADVTESGMSELDVETLGAEFATNTQNLRWGLVKGRDDKWQIEDEGDENKIVPSSTLLLPGDSEFIETFSPPSEVKELKVMVENFQDGRFFSLVRALTNKFGKDYLISIAGNFNLAQLNHLARLGVKRFEFESAELASKGLVLLEIEGKRIRYKEYFTHRRELE